MVGKKAWFLRSRKCGPRFWLLRLAVRGLGCPRTCISEGWLPCSGSSAGSQALGCPSKRGHWLAPLCSPPPGMFQCREGPLLQPIFSSSEAVFSWPAFNIKEHFFHFVMGDVLKWYHHWSCDSKLKLTLKQAGRICERDHSFYWLTKVERRENSLKQGVVGSVTVSPAPDL